MPLYRLRQRLKREDGVEVDYSTLVDYVGKAHAVLAPVATRIREKALAADVLAADDTGFKFLTDENEAGSQRGRLWAYIGDEKWAFYAFTPTWEGKYPQAVLDEREGPVVTDAYAGYDAVFKKGDAVEVGCWAHTRRYFYEAMMTGDLDAVRPLPWIENLFLVEADLKERDADVDEVGRVRQELSRPLTDKVFKEVARLAGRVVPKSPLGRAVTYATNQREALLRFLDDGRLLAAKAPQLSPLRPQFSTWMLHSARVMTPPFREGGVSDFSGD